MSHALPDVHPDLEQLLYDARTRGWRPDTAKNAPQGRWIDEDDQCQITLVPPDIDFGIAVLSAHTPRNQIRMTIGRTADLPQATAALRTFLGWDDDHEEDNR